MAFIQGDFMKYKSSLCLKHPHASSLGEPEDRFSTKYSRQYQ